MRLFVEPHTLVLVFALLFALFVLLVWRAFRRWTSDATDAFDVRDFVMQNGKASTIKLLLLGAFGSTTWAFVYLFLTGKGDIGTILSYGGLWVVPLLGQLAKDAFGGGSPKEEPKP